LLVDLREGILVLSHHCHNSPVLTLIERLVETSLAERLSLPNPSLASLVRPANQVQAVVKGVFHHAQWLCLNM
jgi:hypothetical protein